MQGTAEATGEVTRLLGAWRAGDASASDALLRLVYAELKGIAARRLARLGGVAPIDPTELVSEAVLRLLGSTPEAHNRQHFFSIAAAAIRYALVDTIRHRQADKRGGGGVAITLSSAMAQIDTRVAAGEQWLEVEDALRALERHDPRKCRMIELTFLVGLSQQEVAQTLDVSLTTVERDLRFAKAWLREHLAA
jgi:RNA polymerase sigma factor (TIGR02999 family)